MDTPQQETNNWKELKTPRQIFDALFQGLSEEEELEKYRLINELTAGYQLEINKARGERYKLEQEVAKLNRILKSDEEHHHRMKEALGNMRRTCTGTLNAVSAMLDYSGTGTHRMKHFYAQSIQAFIHKAQADIEAERNLDDLPF